MVRIYHKIISMFLVVRVMTTIYCIYSQFPDIKKWAVKTVSSWLYSVSSSPGIEAITSDE